MSKNEEPDNFDPKVLDSDIDISELIQVVWSNKLSIVSITLLISFLSALYSLSIENFYESESILVSSNSTDVNSFSQYSGLASLAGVNLPNGGSDSVVEVIEIIKSREFVKHLITFEGVLPSLTAADSFDKTSNKLLFNTNLYDEENENWLSENGKPLKPSYLEAHRIYLDEVISISQDNKTGLVSITVRHISPIFAYEFLDLVIREANNLKRDKDISISGKALTYLKAELTQTPLLEIKESINQLIKAQMETAMMAKVNEDYSLMAIEPPFVPDRKSGPNRTLIVVLAAIIGSFSTLIIVLIRHYFFQK